MARAANREIPKRAGLALACGLALGLVLGGCAMNGGSDASRAGGGLDLLGGAARTVERDVEAPDVFSLEEPGLWDGRPSLGGVWVAHPDVRDPERVVIRNGQNGETVIGALFRRERENPGPRFQISSEAANALGILPGQPTTLRVTALRLQTLEVEAPAAQTASTAASAADAESGAVASVEITQADEAPRRGLFGGVFQRRSADAPARAPEAIAETALAAPTGAGVAPADPVVVPAAQPTSTGTSTGAQTQARENRGLLGGLFSRRQPEPEPATIPLPETAMAQPAPQIAPQPAVQGSVQPASASASASGVASALDRPFVQIGIFSVESNADNARRQMQAAGLNAEIRRGRANERDFWRVVVGPAATQDARGAILRQVRGLGFADAYAVVR
ncbi:MAG: SPOR domain-containing protein [Pararhodobacter sp.]